MEVHLHIQQQIQRHKQMEEVQNGQQHTHMTHQMIALMLTGQNTIHINHQHMDMEMQY